MKKKEKQELITNENEEVIVSEESVETVTKEKKKFFSKKSKEKKPHIKLKDLPKDVRKKKIRKYILIGVAAFILLLIIVSKISAANVKYPVTTVPVQTGDVESIITTSGNVESDIKKTYYTQITGIIGSIPVKAGQAVEEGDVLLNFEEQSLTIARQRAQAEALTSDGSFKDTMNQNAKTAGKLTEATVNLEVLEQQITDYKAFIKEQEIKLEDMTNARKADLYAKELELTERQHDGEDVSDEMAEISYLQSMLPISKDLTDIQRTIDDAKETLSNLESYKTEMKSQKGSTEDGVMSSTTSEAKKTTNEATVAEKEQIVNYADAVAGGLKAEFAGVVTEVTAAEGAPVASGAALLTVSSNKQVHITVNLSKTDLAKVEAGQKADVTIAGKAYEGEVSMINHMATLNSNNTPVVSAQIAITNADADIYLGVEAKVKIHAQKSENVLIVPVEAVNSDKNGDFVYVVENGIVTRKNVVTGVSSDEYTEITEGLKENDQVLTDISTAIVEGMEVTPIPIITDQATSETQSE